MQNVKLDEAQAGIKLPGEISTTSDIQMIPNGRNLRGTKVPLDNKISYNCFIEKLVTVMIVKQALF